MSGEKEIRVKIKSIQSTQKITKAMEMVAASKMRKAQDRMAQSRPYADKMKGVIGHLAHAHPEYKHPFMQERDEVKRVGYIVISTDRGLCGGLNINMFKATLASMREWSNKGVEIDTVAIGKKAGQLFKRMKASIKGEFSGFGDHPHIEQLIGAIKVLLDAYKDGDLDRLYLVHNVFVNSMTQSPQVTQLLPLEKSVEEGEDISHHWDYIYEPDAPEVLDGLLVRYIESLVYQGVVENIACEMSARMIAMKSATDNAGELINELQLVYNKARQAAITQEISEIVAGAAAV